jgi:hypothetical protein
MLDPALVPRENRAVDGRNLPMPGAPAGKRMSITSTQGAAPEVVMSLDLPTVQSG